MSCDTRTPGAGGSLVSSLSCSSQCYSNLSLPWSEMAFSTVLAWRVGKVFRISLPRNPLLKVFSFYSFYYTTIGCEID